MRAFALTMLVLIPASGRAQTTPRVPFVPAISLDGLVGVTYGPAHVGTFSYNTTTTAARIAVTVRLGSRGAVRPILTLDYSGMPGRAQGYDVVLNPNGTTSRQEFPEYSGFSVGLGARAALGPRFTGGATAGIGRYQDHYTTAGRRNAFRIDADKVWFRPITLGLRVQ